MEREQAFDDDYLYFYAQLLTDERSEQEVDLIWRLLELERGLAVLDLACGHGRIANRLAERGAYVTGLDATPRFLELAREDAAARGVEVDYVEGDMRAPPWEGRFDRALSWFTSFGYFDDEGNRAVLAAVFRTLKPGGRFLIDLNNRDWIMGNYRAQSVLERDGNFMLDSHSYNPLSGLSGGERIIVRDGRTRRFDLRIRMFPFTELRGWLEQAGFEDVSGYGRDGEPLTINHPRMVVVARRPPD
jgi:SAM-dependent methyltransferase